MSPAASFERELDLVLPADLPERAAVLSLSAAHLALIEETNQYLNLTRITSAREAAIKHVLDSVIPWRLFLGARSVLDAGSGAGFPGIPLAITLPAVRFVLAESIQKKARFIESALLQLGLPNASVQPRRAEELERFDVITARALAPLTKALALFGPALKRGTRLLLYKGPDVATEIAEASNEIRKLKAKVEVLMRYDLPDSMGSRAILEVKLGS